MESLRVAASFLTRIPLHRDDGSTAAMSRAVPWFGVVGLILGTLQGVIYVGLYEVSSPVLAAAIAVAALALITGAFHHDGLADVADAFGGGWTVEERLEIMQDSRLGTYGVTALVLVVIVEVAALSSISDGVAIAGAIVAHGLSRSLASVAMIAAPPARETGLGVDFIQDVSKRAIARASLLTVAITVVFFGVAALPILLGAYGAGELIVRLADTKIGGISGDVLGAIQQITKVTTLTMVVIAAEVTADPGILGGLALR